MVDDELYGALTVGFALGMRLSDLLGMPPKELAVWGAFLARRAQEQGGGRGGGR